MNAPGASLSSYRSYLILFEASRAIRLAEIASGVLSSDACLENFLALGLAGRGADWARKTGRKFEAYAHVERDRMAKKIAASAMALAANGRSYSIR
jgi:hypothetical protein